MRSKFSTARIVLAAALTFAGTVVGLKTLAVSAAVDNPPVSIDDDFVTAYKGATVARFHHRFTNQAAVAADIVRFAVDLGPGNKPLTITETGTFSPGVRIDREDNLARYFYQMSPRIPTCSVTYVHFIDGTSWTAPSSQ